MGAAYRHFSRLYLNAPVTPGSALKNLSTYRRTMFTFSPHVCLSCKSTCTGGMICIRRHSRAAIAVRQGE
eukprot:6209889-Pleurochrysis_carterae.AAC.1